MLSTSTIVFSEEIGDAESSLALRLLLLRERSDMVRFVTKTQSRQPGIVQPDGGGR